MKTVLMRPPAVSKLRRWRRRLGFVGVALLVVVLVTEVVLRLRAYDPRILMRSTDPGAEALQRLVRAQLNMNNLVQYAPDAELGALMAPMREDSFETIDISWTLRTDHAGFANAEPWPGEVDIAVLGNSLLIGPGLGLEGQFTTLLGERLGGRKVLNLGVPGGGTEHQLLTWRRFAEPLQPRLVVSMLWVTWDIDNSRYFVQWQREGKPDPDYTHYRTTYGPTHPDGGDTGDGGAAAPSGLRRAVLFVRRQLARSLVLQAVNTRLEAIGAPGVAQLVRLPSGDDVLLSSRDQERLAEGLARPNEPALEEVFFGPLERLREEVERKGGRFIIVLFPSKEEIYGSDATPEILRAIEEVRAGLGARRLPVLDLYPIFRELGRERPLFYAIDIHPNERGSSVLADTIAAWARAEAVFPQATAAPVVRDRE